MDKRFLCASFGLALLWMGCARQVHPDVGYSRDPAPDSSEESGYRHPSRHRHADPLLGADREFHGVRLSDDSQLDAEELLDALATYDLVCFGEDHDDAIHHWSQLAVLHGLQVRAQASGRELGLGVEMIEASFRRSVSDFNAGEMRLKDLPEAVEWASRWGYDFALYRPLFAFAQRHRIPVVALNVSREIVHAVAQDGLASLAPEQMHELPRLDLEDAEHRAAFDRQMADHPETGHPDDIYAAQVVWDETMARNASAWLAEHQPARQLVVLAGAAHCRSSAIPARVSRRMPDSRVAAILPERRAEQSDDDRSGYDYVLMLEDSPRP